MSNLMKKIFSITNPCYDDPEKKYKEKIKKLFSENLAMK
jgi:hypothetical protein